MASIKVYVVFTLRKIAPLYFVITLLDLKQCAQSILDLKKLLVDSSGFTKSCNNTVTHSSPLKPQN